MVKSCVVVITIFHSFVAPSSRNGQGGIKVRHVYGQCMPGEEHANVGEAIGAVLVRWKVARTENLLPWLLMY